jgi:hypothetical protein
LKPHPNHPPPPIARKLPDFRNLGVLLLVNLLAVATLP